MNYSTTQPKGASQIAILSIVLVVAIILAGGVYWYSRNQENGNGNTNTVANVNTANENINIATNLNTNALANLNTNSVVNQNFNVNTVTNSNVSANSNTNLDTSNWKTYQDDEFGFSFQYPKEWRLSSDPNGTISVVPLTFQEPLPLIKAVVGTVDEALKWLNENRTESGSGTFQKTNDIYSIIDTTGSIYQLGGNRFVIV